MRALLFGVFTACLCGQPAIRSVFNAADYFSPDGNSIARGAMFVVYGADIGRNSPVSRSFPLTDSLAGVRVQVMVGNIRTAAWPVYVARDRVEAILPSATPAGEGTVTIMRDGGESAPVPVQVVERAFNGFLRFRDSEVRGRFTKHSADGESSATPDAPARPGQIVSIWGTGLGAVTRDEAASPQPGDMALPVTVRVADTAARVLYAGRSGCCAGLDQIIIEVPHNAPAGCSVPVQVSVAGAPVRNTMALPISDTGTPCETRAGLNGATLAAAGESGRARIGILNMARVDGWIYSSVQPPQSRLVDMFGAAFYDWSATDIAETITRGQTSVGGCTLRTVYSSPIVADGLPMYPVVPPLPAPSLDAGSTLQVVSSAGARDIPPNNSAYAATQDRGGWFASSENVTVSGAGGRDVGPFSIAQGINSGFKWLNRDELREIAQDQPLVFKWLNAAPGGFVSVAGESRNTDQGLYVRFECIAPADAGQFTVPGWVRASIPRTAVPRGMALSAEVRITSYGRSEIVQVPGVAHVVSGWSHSVSLPTEFR